MTTPVEITTLRMALLSQSATNRLVPSVVIPAGELNLAAAPVPSVEPDALAVPAIVVTTPVEITTLRIVLLSQSVTKRLVPSVVMPEGFEKLAAAPVLSIEFGPASVETVSESERALPCIAPPINIDTAGEELDEEPPQAVKTPVIVSTTKSIQIFLIITPPLKRD